MQGFLAGGVCFAEKQLRVCPSFQILAFHILVHLTILDEHLFVSKHGSKSINHTTVIITIIFHLLLYVTEIVKQSQTVRDGQFESSFLNLQCKPNIHVWETMPPRQLFPFLPGSWIRATRP